MWIWFVIRALGFSSRWSRNRNARGVADQHCFSATGKGPRVGKAFSMSSGNKPLHTHRSLSVHYGNDTTWLHRLNLDSLWLFAMIISNQTLWYPYISLESEVQLFVLVLCVEGQLQWPLNQFNFVSPSRLHFEFRIQEFKIQEYHILKCSEVPSHTTTDNVHWVLTILTVWHVQVLVNTKKESESWL